MTDQYLAYVGTYTRDNSDGIYGYWVDRSTGEFDPLGSAPAGEDPSFLALHPNGTFLYAVNEADHGTVTAFEIDRVTGDLRRLNQVAIGGEVPCHCSIDATGQYLLAAHYGGGSISALPIEDDGRVDDVTQVIEHEGNSVHPRRQTQPRPHSIVFGPEERFVYVPDLGADRVVVYEFDPDDGPLKPSDTVALHERAGPRHLDFHPDGTYAYLINELDSTLTAFERDPETGALSEIATVSTLPESYEGTNFTADVHVHPSGQWVYGSNRGHDSIAVFAIEKTTGRPELIAHESTRGETPRNFALDPAGNLLFAENQDTDDVYAYRIQNDGKLDVLGHVADVPRPVCLVLLDPK